MNFENEITPSPSLHKNRSVVGGILHITTDKVAFGFFIRNNRNNKIGRNNYSNKMNPILNIPPFPHKLPKKKVTGFYDSFNFK